jgi:hypothetical protein
MNDRGRSVKPFELEEAARKHEHIETRKINVQILNTDRGSVNN